MRNMSIFIPEGAYYTPVEASQYLGVTRSYVCRLVDTGKMFGIRVGKNAYLIPAEDVAERKRNPPSVGRRRANAPG